MGEMVQIRQALLIFLLFFVYITDGNFENLVWKMGFTQVIYWFMGILHNFVLMTIAVNILYVKMAFHIADTS